EVRCCTCGRVNRSLLLEETDGLFECEECGTVNLCIPFRDPEDQGCGGPVSFYSLAPAPERREHSHVHGQGTV
ncbi:MAG: hypothetical protein J5744_00975, partial [Oscillospiraceae bacterium]|nr:hypothetical protein [Oscillospiraceae bacterium]